MARVSISINNQTYDIACADGEEQHILDLAGVVDAKVGELVSAIGQAGEARLLAMAGLLMADDLAETRDEIATLRSAAEIAEPSAVTPSAPTIDENRLADILDTMAVRIETIAEDLERA
ncbi:cell division protein ZapA [Magnetovibrio sp.]|uniref:cell division protein ZapA n=1 Tax=Magnetovibrio sp. TaxID=2024836 RepID=UPI002F954A0E